MPEIDQNRLMEESGDMNFNRAERSSGGADGLSPSSMTRETAIKKSGYASQEKVEEGKLDALDKLYDMILKNPVQQNMRPENN